MLVEKLLDNLDIPTVVIIAVFGVSLIAYLVVKISGMVVSKKLKPLAEMLNAEIKASFLGGTYISILNYGPEIRLKLMIGGGDNPSALILELLSPVGFRFKILKKEGLSQVFSLWGKDVEINDASFEEDCLIRSDKPEEASSYLMDARRIDAIKYFLENGFSRIEANDKGVYASKINYTDEDLNPGRVGTYLDNLISFSRM
jgi:hypothetical protein